MKIDLTDVDDEEQPDDPGVAAAKAVVEWMESGNPAFLEAAHGDAKGAVFNESDGSVVVLASVDGNEEFRATLNLATARIIHAAALSSH